MWNIGIYIRLSVADGKDESLSISNQKKVLFQYVKEMFKEKYQVIKVYADDGATGTDDTRTGFQEMVADVAKGMINCIICKNLSRIFRNYADQGYFLEEFFPLYKVRFITMGDPKIDTLLNPDAVSGLEIPIMGIMNDRYAQKTSEEIRRTFLAMRKTGEFVGGFAPYGYLKDPNDKHKFIIDVEAAKIVARIFNWFVYEGISKNGIAKRLNSRNVPNPTKYKELQGLNYKNPSGRNNDGMWSGATIGLILKNKVYLGHMVQGKQQVVSYKIHKQIRNPEEQWTVVENTHKPVISQGLFQKAQNTLSQRLKSGTGKNQVYLFSGLLKCGDCHKVMGRNQSKGIVYYSCRTYKDKGLCTKHSIREDEVQLAVISLLEAYRNIFVGPLAKRREEACESDLILENRGLLKENLKLSDQAYLDWKKGIIDHLQYERIKSHLVGENARLQKKLESLEIKQKLLVSQENCPPPALTHRSLLVSLIDHIDVYENKQLIIHFNCADPLAPKLGI